MAIVISLMALLLAGAGAASAVTVTVAPGWPLRAAAGPVLPGPDGGFVVVSYVSNGQVHRVTAYRRDGGRLWTSRRKEQCGNCDEGPQPPRLQPDGTYGPIGPEGDDFWAVSPRGGVVEGCAGVVTADGSCFTAGQFLRDLFSGSPGIRGRPAGAPPWEVVDTAFRWSPSRLGVPPMAVDDSGGIVYAAFGGVAEVATGGGLPGVLMAVDPVAKAALWTRTGPRQVLTGLTSGVLTWEAGCIETDCPRLDGRLVAFDASGGIRWTRPLAGWASAPGTAFDAARDRIYLGGDRFRGVMALDAATGDLTWRTRTRDRADLLSVGRSGRVYVAIHRPGREAVRALRLTDGSTLWERRTRMPVLGAHELPNGSVAVSAGIVNTATGRTTVLRPRGR